MTVTRTVIAHFAREAFARTPGSISRDEIIDTAVAHRAPPEVLYVLNQLPDRRFLLLNEIWVHLKEVPLG